PYLSSMHPTPPPSLYTLSLHDALPICRSHESLTYEAAVDHNIADRRQILFGEVSAVDSNRGMRSMNQGFERFRAVRETLRCLHGDRKSTRLNSSHQIISYAVFCLKKTT